MAVATLCPMPLPAAGGSRDPTAASPNPASLANGRAFGGIGVEVQDGGGSTLVRVEVELEDNNKEDDIDDIALGVYGLALFDDDNDGE